MRPLKESLSGEERKSRLEKYNNQHKREMNQYNVQPQKS